MRLERHDLQSKYLVGTAYAHSALKLRDVGAALGAKWLIQIQTTMLYVNSNAIVGQKGELYLHETSVRILCHLCELLRALRVRKVL